VKAAVFVILAIAGLAGCATASQNGNAGAVADLRDPGVDILAADGVWDGGPDGRMIVSGDRVTVESGCGDLLLRPAEGPAPIADGPGRTYRLVVEAFSPADDPDGPCEEAQPGVHVALVVLSLALHPAFDSPGGLVMRVSPMTERSQVLPWHLAMMSLRRMD